MSPFFYPEVISTGKYNFALTQALHDAGASVQVVCFHPSYPSWKPSLCFEQLPDVPARRGGRWVRYPRHPLLRRLILELSFAWHAAVSVFRLRHEVDMAVLVFPPSLAALLTDALFPPSVRRIGIVHDLQGMLGLNDGTPMQRVLRRIVHAVEKRAFRSCDRLILLSQDMSAAAKTEFQLDQAKLQVCYPFVTIRNVAHIGSRLAHLFRPSAHHVVYSGALGEKQNSYELAGLFQKAAAALPEVHFHIFSGGPVYNALTAQNSQRSIANLHFHDLVKDSDLAELYSRSTVQVIPLLDLASYACLPSKLPNILAAGCPVLAICNQQSELARLLQLTSSAVVTPSWNPSQFIESVRQALTVAHSSTHELRKSQAQPLLSSYFNLGTLVSAVLDADSPLRQNRSLQSAVHGSQSH